MEFDFEKPEEPMDLADVGANVEHGCHIASMGGTWMAAVYGAAGMRDYDGQLSFNPALGPNLDCLGFNLILRGQRLHITLDQKKAEATYLIKDGTELTIIHQGEELRLTKGKPVQVKIKES